MSKYSAIIIWLAVAFLSIACSSHEKIYEDDEDIQYIDNDSLSLESKQEEQQISRHNKLSQGYRRTFNDVNDIHLRAAYNYGIEPLESLASADSCHFTQLLRIDSCEYYTVKKLTHSAPYLTPRAKWVLMTIGKNFQDSLAVQGVDGCQIVVTSLLRTDDSIKRLRRRNRNASNNSAHRYGTTFDISYINFNYSDSTNIIPAYQLKRTLAEVLYDLRAANRCVVKYEVKQSCFHITAL